MPKNPLNKLTGVKYTAVDFGHHSLKAVHCKTRGSNIKVLNSGMQSLPFNSIVNGKIDDIALITDHLNDLFTEAKINPGNIIFAPAAGQEFVRKVEVPVMPDDELEEALRWEVQEYLNLPPEKVASDFLILDEGENNYEILLALMPLHILDDYKEVFSRLGYKANVANMQELALISLLSYQDKMEEANVILNIGANKTRILIASEDKFYLSRSVDIAGNNLTRLFKEEDNTWDEADEKKKQSEFNPENVEDEEDQTNFDMVVSGFSEGDNLQSRMKNLIDDLLEEINRSLEYYRDRNPEKPLNQVYLTGGGSRLYGLQKYLSEKLELEIVNINPFSEFNMKNNVEFEDNSKLSVAAGLVASEVIFHES